MDTITALRTAEIMIEQKRLRSAISIFEKALNTSTDTKAQSILSFQLGALYWGEIGDGEKARGLFRRAVDLIVGLDGHETNDRLLEIEANACENLMILALSYEEYELWAGWLEKLQPDNAILLVHRPEVRELIQKGISWSDHMSGLSRLYLDPKPSEGHRYPSGACLLQLMINHREVLRLSREDWRNAVIGYGAASLAIVSDCGQEMEQVWNDYYPDEFVFIASDAIPLVETYVKENMSDDKAQDVLNHLKLIIEQAKDLNHKSGLSTISKADNVTNIILESWWYFFLLIILGGMWGLRLLPQLPDLWAVIIGGFVGLMIAYFLSKLRNPVQPTQTTQRSTGIHWVSNSHIIKGAKATGVYGLRFRLVKTAIEIDGSLGLKFQPLETVPEELAYNAGLALRSIVGLTFPYLVTRVKGLKVIEDKETSYTIRLGRGVPMSGYWIQYGLDRIGPLQMTSEEFEGYWYVYITPLIIKMMSDFQQFSLQGKILSMVAVAFESLKEYPVILGA